MLMIKIIGCDYKWLQEFKEELNKMGAELTTNGFKVYVDMLLFVDDMMTFGAKCSRGQYIVLRISQLQFAKMELL